MNSGTFDKLTDEIAETAFSKLLPMLEAYVDRKLRSEVKLTFSEAEAAKQLGVSRETLAKWRKDGLISFAQYPQVRADALSTMYSYTTEDLLAFRERYLRKGL